MLRVSMVRMELCSTRTMGRSARRGILDLVCRGLGGDIDNGGSACVRDGEVPIASMERQLPSRGNAGDATALTDTWIDSVYTCMWIWGYVWFQESGGCGRGRQAGRVGYREHVGGSGVWYV